VKENYRRAPLYSMIYQQLYPQSENYLSVTKTGILAAMALNEPADALLLAKNIEPKLQEWAKNGTYTQEVAEIRNWRSDAEKMLTQTTPTKKIPK
jgi:hypothetical protein